MPIKRDTHLRVPKTVSLPWDLVKEQLWIPNRQYERAQQFNWGNQDVLPGLNLLEECNGHYLMPRNYLLPGSNHPTALGKKYHTRPVEMPPFRLSLWEQQEAVADALMERCGHDKILGLGCGKGKTIMALWYADQLQQKTLIVVDRDFLLDQWVRRIKQCFWLPRSRIGVVQGKKRRVGEHITVAMVKTLINRDFGHEWYEQFGLGIFDECHVMAAPTFAPISGKLLAERLGLTATPERRDGMDPVFKLHLGEVCYEDYSRNRSAMWAFYRLPSLLAPQTESACYRYAGKKRDGSNRYVFNRSRYDTLAGTSQMWNERIVAEVRKASNAGRYTLVLGTRTDQLWWLKGELAEHGVDAGYVDAKVKGQKRWRAFGKRVILATQSLASRALDIPRLDTLVLLYPSDDDGFIRQAVGRLDRDEGFEPIVVVFSHYSIDSMRNKEDRMRGVIEEIDPGARIVTAGVSHGSWNA